MVPTIRVQFPLVTPVYFFYINTGSLPAGRQEFPSLFILLFFFIDSSLKRGNLLFFLILYLLDSRFAPSLKLRRDEPTPLPLLTTPTNTPNPPSAFSETGKGGIIIFLSFPFFSCHSREGGNL